MDLRIYFHILFKDWFQIFSPHSSSWKDDYRLEFNQWCVFFFLIIIIFHRRNQYVLRFVKMLYLSFTHMFIWCLRYKKHLLLWRFSDSLEGMQCVAPKKPDVTHCKQKGMNERLGPRATFCQKLINSVWDAAVPDPQAYSCSLCYKFLMWCWSAYKPSLFQYANCYVLSFICTRRHILLCVYFVYTRIHGFDSV